MQRFLITNWFLVVSVSHLFAQTTKPDLIVKTDKSQIAVRVIGIDPSAIRYRRLRETTVRRINRTLVWKVIYGTGVVRVITPPIVSAPPVVATNPRDTLLVNEPENNPNPMPNQQAELDKVIQDLEKDVSVQGRKIRLHPIFFDTGSNTVLPQSFPYLDSIALFLVKIPTSKVEIGGHTDNTGSVAVNNQLSQQRANAVRNYLVNQKKIAASRIIARGYGQQEPVAKNSTDQGRALNRRVELKFLESGNDVYVIRLKNGQRIQTTFVVISTDNKTVRYRQKPNTPLIRIAATEVDYIEEPNGNRQKFDTGKNPDGHIPPPPLPKHKAFTIQVNGLPAYMLGSDLWKVLPNGYGHTIGVGGSLQFDYWLGKRVSVGAELGYGVWKTQVNVLNSPGEKPYAVYFTESTRYGILAHVRLGLVGNFYLMPQGGANQLAVSIYDDTDKINFSGIQTNYGGTLGYLIPLGRTWNIDLGVFYQIATGSKKLQTDYGIEPMKYAGVRLGLGFSR